MDLLVQICVITGSQVSFIYDLILNFEILCLDNLPVRAQEAVSTT